MVVKWVNLELVKRVKMEFLTMAARMENLEVSARDLVAYDL